MQTFFFSSDKVAHHPDSTKLPPYYFLCVMYGVARSFEIFTVFGYVLVNYEIDKKVESGAVARHLIKHGNPPVLFLKHYPRSKTASSKVECDHYRESITVS
jgi:hypothetical protein